MLYLNCRKSCRGSIIILSILVIMIKKLKRNVGGFILSPLTKFSWMLQLVTKNSLSKFLSSMGKCDDDIRKIRWRFHIVTLNEIELDAATSY